MLGNSDNDGCENVDDEFRLNCANEAEFEP